MKFKVGDKVKVVGLNGDENKLVELLMIGKIIDIDLEYLEIPYFVEFENCKEWFSDYELALISEESKPTSETPTLDYEKAYKKLQKDYQELQAKYDYLWNTIIGG